MKIFVGVGDTRTEFDVPKNLLIEQSLEFADWFKKIASSGPAATKLDYSEEDPGIFSILVKWLDSRCVPGLLPPLLSDIMPVSTSFSYSMLFRQHSPWNDPWIFSQFCWDKVCPHPQSMLLVAVADHPQSQRPENTKITRAQKAQLLKILEKTCKTELGRAFRAPVDDIWQDFAVEYAKEIANPIDLGRYPFPAS